MTAASTASPSAEGPGEKIEWTDGGSNSEPADYERVHEAYWQHLSKPKATQSTVTTPGFGDVTCSDVELLEAVPASKVPKLLKQRSRL